MHLMRRGPSITIFVTVTLTFVVCTGERPNVTAWDGVVRDSAGFQIVENRGAPHGLTGRGGRFRRFFESARSKAMPSTPSENRASDVERTGDE